MSDISRGFFQPWTNKPRIQAKVRREGRAAVQCLLHVSLSATRDQETLPFYDRERVRSVNLVHLEVV